MPEAWQRGIILLIPKKKDQGPPDPNLHHGILVCCRPYIRFCTEMNSRVEAFVEGENLSC